MRNRFTYYIPRILSVVLTTIITALNAKVLDGADFKAIIIGVLAASIVVIVLCLIYNKYEDSVIFAVFPFSLWVYFFTYLMCCGFTNAFTLEEFLFLSIYIFIPLFASIIAWKNGLIGGVVFFCIGIWCTLWLSYRGYALNRFQALFMTLPIFLIAILFIIDHLEYKKD